jgi:hypothetical protein
MATTVAAANHETDVLIGLRLLMLFSPGLDAERDLVEDARSFDGPERPYPPA